MGIEVNYGYMFCNTSDVYFGPQFDSDDDAESFIRWCRKYQGDPRKFSNESLEFLKKDWERDCAHDKVVKKP